MTTHDQILNDIDETRLKKIHENQLLIERSGNICTIDDTEVSDRVTLVETLKDSLISHQQQDDQFILCYEFSSGIAHQLIDFILAEQGCCDFFDFGLDFYKKQEIIEFKISSKNMSTDKLSEIVNNIFVDDK